MPLTLEYFTMGVENNRIAAKETTQYNLVLPGDLYRQVKETSRDKGVSMSNFFRTCINLGLIYAESKSRGGKLIMREQDGKETEVIIL